jgi:hypothetical protein
MTGLGSVTVHAWPAGWVAVAETQIKKSGALMPEQLPCSFCGDLEDVEVLSSDGACTACVTDFDCDEDCALCGGAR